MVTVSPDVLIGLPKDDPAGKKDAVQRLSIQVLQVQNGRAPTEECWRLVWL